MAEGGNPNFGQVPLSCDICESTDHVNWNCVDCKVNLCETCYNDHTEGRPMSFFKNHKVVHVEEVLRSRYSEERCSIHPVNVYILHCNTCRQLVCPDCFTEAHKEHNLCKIGDAMEKAFQDITQYTEMIGNSLLPQCDALKIKISENINQCEEWYTQHENQVQKKREELIFEVHRQCDELLQAVRREKMKSLEPVEQDKALVHAKDVELKVLLDTKHEVMKKKNSEIIQFTKDIENIILPTVRSTQFPSYMEKQIDSLQVIHTCITIDDQKMLHPNVEEHSDEYITPPGGRMNKPIRKQKKGKGERHQGQQLEKSCITDIKILGRHKLKDSIYNIDADCTDTAWVSSLCDTKIIQVSTKGKQLNEIKTNIEISDFKIIGSDDFIITHLGDRCLKRYSRTGQVITNIRTDPYLPSGICLTQDEQHLAVCLYSEDTTSKLGVYKTDGQLLQTIHYTDSKSSKFYTQRVAANESGDFCVAHRGLNKVFGISNSGRGALRFTYGGFTDPQCTGQFCPRGIVCDRYNHLLISNSYDSTIHMLDQEGQFLRYLLTYAQHGIVEPRALSIDSKGKLWIGNNDGTLLVLVYLK